MFFQIVVSCRELVQRDVHCVDDVAAAVLLRCPYIEHERAPVDHADGLTGRQFRGAPHAQAQLVYNDQHDEQRRRQNQKRMIAGKFQDLRHECLEGLRIGKRRIIAAGNFAAALVAGLCLLGGAPSLAAGADKDNEAELERVRARIENLRLEMREDVQARDALDARLRDSEEQVAEVTRRLAKLRGARRASEQRLSGLREKQATREAALAGERAALAGQLRAAWMNGRQERLKLILNQQDPAALGRLLVYYGYFNRLRAVRIEEVGRQLTELDRIGVELEIEQQRLLDLEASRAGELEHLQAARRERAASLVALGKRIAERGGEVARLEAQEKALTELIDELRRALAELPVTGQEPFETVRGKLSWPVTGHLLSDFGQTRAGGRLEWHGVLLGAERGTEVEAIYHGRVAYADWLPGLGLLLVIEHGDGYMSLYAHNQTLLKSVGDWVAPREAVATVGDSGGRSEPALYFEIRRERQPLDPHEWINQKLASEN